MTQQAQIEQILNKAKKLAIQHRNLTGRSLGITGEIGEFTAAKLLKLELATARQACYNAIGDNPKAFYKHV